jgi:transcriptional regulator with XRE-family HTH domain
MPPVHGSPAARLLGEELRIARLRRGKNAGQVAPALGVSPSWMSRLEHGRRPPPAALLDTMLRIYRIPEPDAARLRALRDRAAAEHDAADLATTAELSIWEAGVIPPALRTEAYARAVLAAQRRVLRLPPSQIKAAIAADRDWQARLRGEEDTEPLGLSCVLDEAVLTRRRGPTSAMAGQLDHLAALARLACVSVRILPLDADGPAFGSFTVAGYDDEDMAGTVLLAGPAGVQHVTEGQAVEGYRLLFEELQSAAADEEESAAIIKCAADRWA